MDLWTVAEFTLDQGSEVEMPILMRDQRQRREGRKELSVAPGALGQTTLKGYCHCRQHQSVHEVSGSAHLHLNL